MDKKTALYIADLAMNRYEATLTIFVQDVIIRYLFDRVIANKGSFSPFSMRPDCLWHLKALIKTGGDGPYKEEEYTKAFNLIWEKLAPLEIADES